MRRYEMRIKRFFRWIFRNLLILFVPHRLSVLHLASCYKKEREELDEDVIDE